MQFIHFKVCITMLEILSLGKPIKGSECYAGKVNFIFRTSIYKEIPEYLTYFKSQPTSCKF